MHRSPYLFYLVGLMCACGGADEPPVEPRWLENVEVTPPAELSKVGLFTSIAERTPHGDLLAYTPPHSLWSNGLTKERLLHVPAGAPVDASAPRSWIFPEGTVFAKTFVHEGAPVETRLLFRTTEKWDYALYEWAADGSDATLLSGNWPEQPLDLDGVPHTLPSRLDCRTCHETHEEVWDTPVLGVSGLQLSDDIAANVAFAGAVADEPVEGATPAETAAFGYFVGNCVSCHNGGSATNSSFSLFPDQAVATTVNQATESETGEGIRVVPGDLEQSVLYESVTAAHAADYTGPFKAMPPLGVSVADPEAASVIGAWIEGLAR